MGTKRLTKEQVFDRIINPEKYPNETPWYKSNLVSKSYSKYAAEAIMENYEKTRKIPNVKVDERCNYNKGERDRIRDKLKYILDDVEKTDNYIADLDNGSEKPRMEERMCHCLFAQGKVSNFEVKDYQIPTTNGGHDKIDLLLQQGDTVYMTETKKFSKISEKFGRTPSDETMLRCVLEIQTYYQKINHNFIEKCHIQDKSKIRKAILVDTGTQAFADFQNMDYAKKILEFFDITLLKLDRVGPKFTIEKIYPLK